MIVFTAIGVFAVWLSAMAVGGLASSKLFPDEFGGLGGLLGFFALYVTVTVAVILYFLIRSI
jgi:hypothetical protein